MYYFSEYLKNQLNHIIDYPLTIVEASPGYGKSTAVNEYFLKAKAGKYRKLFYTFLGEPAVSSWKGIVREFSKIDKSIGQYLSSLSVAVPGNVGEIASQMNHLSCEEPTILCLDNFHLFAISNHYQLIAALSLHRCPNLHIIVITQPCMETARETYHLRFHGHWITADTLLFSKQDIDTLFQKEGFCLSAKNLNDLWQITEGYAAALPLQLESWRHHHQFEESHSIAGLIRQFLWRNLKEQEKFCLIRLSVMDSFTLNESVLIADGQMSPNELTDFFARIDFIRYETASHHYVFHRLLRACLEAEFHCLSAAAQKEIWLLAAKACKQSERFLQAAYFYSKAQDFQSLLSLPFGSNDLWGLVQMENGDIIKLILLEPQRELLKEHPELTMRLTFKLYFQGKFLLYRQYLTECQMFLQMPQLYDERRFFRLQGEYALMQSFCAFNDVPMMCLYHKKAWKLLNRPTELYSHNAAWTFGTPSIVCLFWRKAGELEHQLLALAEGMPLYGKLTNGHGAGASHAMCGEIALLRGDDKLAEAEYRQALYEAERLHQDSIFYCSCLGMARIALLRRNVSGYTQMLEKIDSQACLSEENFSVFTTAMCKSYLSLLLGLPAELPQWLTEKERHSKHSPMFSLPFVHILYARLLLHRLKKQPLAYERFAETMGQLTKESENLHMLLPSLYYQIYLAIGADMSGQRSKAILLLHQALSLASADRVWLPFAENYAELKPLLEQLNACGQLKTTREELLTLGERFSKGQAAILNAMHPQTQTLTPREREIALLLRDRHSVKEVAQKLSISPSTVSNIMQHIYSKLEIHSKQELYFREDL